MAERRFVVDEGALTLDNVPEVEREDSFISLIGQLDHLRGSGQDVLLVADWGAVECIEGEDVAQALNNCKILDRDRSMLLLTLLDRCFTWERPADGDFSAEVVVDGNQYDGEGIAWARDQAILQNWIAVITTRHRIAAGVHQVETTSQSGSVNIYFCVSIMDHPGFFRTLYEWEDVPESGFFERARLAFPRLVFAAGLSFRNFQGTYRTLRPDVVHHLGRINDEFPEVYVEERGMSNPESTEGIPRRWSDEG